MLRKTELNAASPVLDLVDRRRLLTAFGTWQPYLDYPSRYPNLSTRLDEIAAENDLRAKELVGICARLEKVGYGMEERRGGVSAIYWQRLSNRNQLLSAAAAIIWGTANGLVGTVTGQSGYAAVQGNPCVPAACSCSSSETHCTLHGGGLPTVPSC